MIKLIELLRENLDEAKQAGLLYHFTNYPAMIKIIKDGFKIKGMGEPYVSLTRNKNMQSDTISNSVRITVDGDGLSNKYKIEPYADTTAGYGRKAIYKKGITGDESEERINSDKYGGYVDISKYIKAIDVKKPIVRIPSDDEDDFEQEPEYLSAFQELISLLKKNNIKYNIIER
jgi:hypothetical protein